MSLNRVTQINQAKDEQMTIAPPCHVMQRAHYEKLARQAENDRYFPDASIAVAQPETEASKQHDKQRGRYLERLEAGRLSYLAECKDNAEQREIAGIKIAEQFNDEC